MKKPELKQIIKEEIQKILSEQQKRTQKLAGILNENEESINIGDNVQINKMSTNQGRDYYEIKFPSGFKDEFFNSMFTTNQIFTDTILGNEHYNQLIHNLKKYNVPYTEAKARLDNAVRIKIKIN
jgi:hypothetical protein